MENGAIEGLYYVLNGIVGFFKTRYLLNYFSRLGDKKEVRQDEKDLLSLIESGDRVERNFYRNDEFK